MTKVPPQPDRAGPSSTASEKMSHDNKYYSIMVPKSTHRKLEKLQRKVAEKGYQHVPRKHWEKLIGKRDTSTKLYLVDVAISLLLDTVEGK